MAVLMNHVQSVSQVVLMPTTRPRTSTNGPPEFPGLIGVSV